MAESREHLRLIDAILRYIEREFAPLCRFAVFDDRPSEIRGEKPPRIAGFVPDVFAEDVPPTVTIIGEAKTSSDLGTLRSRQQIRAFLEHLALRQRGVFIIAVPWQASRAARSVLESTKHTAGCGNVELVVIDGVHR